MTITGALKIDHKMLCQVLSQFDERSSSLGDVVTCLRSSKMSGELESAPDDVIRDSVRELFAQRMNGLAEFLLSRELIDREVCFQIESIVASDRGNDLAAMALRVQSLLLKKIAFERCPPMKSYNLSFERELIPHFPPLFSRFLGCFTTMALLHERGRSEKVRIHLNALDDPPCDPLQFYELLKQLPTEFWTELDLVYRDSTTGHYSDLAHQSPFVKMVVEALVQDSHSLYAIQEDSTLNKSVQAQQLARFMIERLFNQQRYAQACAIGFNIFDASFQEQLCWQSLTALFNQKNSQGIMEVIHLIGDRPFFNNAVECALSAVSSILRSDDFQWFIMLLLSPVAGDKSKSEPLAKAVIAWADKSEDDCYLDIVKQCLKRVRSPFAADIDWIQAKRDFKASAPVIVGLWALLVLFILSQKSNLPSETVDVAGSL